MKKNTEMRSKKSLKTIFQIVDELIKNEIPGGEGLRETLYKELLQRDILYALSRSGLLEKLVLQGGTALRLFHLGFRLSEDMDFVCGDSRRLYLSPEEFQTLGNRFVSFLKTYLKRSYGVDPNRIVVNPPKKPAAISDPETTVQRWRVKVPIDYGRVKTKVYAEVVNVPSYSHATMILRPDKVHSTITAFPVIVEAREELLADKIKAVFTRPYEKHRDLWDIWTLTDAGVKPDWDMVRKKLKDYQEYVTPEIIDARVEKVLVSGPDFFREMAKYVPGRVLDSMNKTNTYDVISKRISGISEIFKTQLNERTKPPSAGRRMR
jgi:hypothetical protein